MKQTQLSYPTLAVSFETTAGKLYDEARFRERMGLAPSRKTFSQIARLTLKEMRRDLAAGTGKKVYEDYCQVIGDSWARFGEADVGCLMACTSATEMSAVNKWSRMEARLYAVAGSAVLKSGARLNGFMRMSFMDIRNIHSCKLIDSFPGLRIKGPLAPLTRRLFKIRIKKGKSPWN
jgi:hypothetical protein